MLDALNRAPPSMSQSWPIIKNGTRQMVELNVGRAPDASMHETSFEPLPDEEDAAGPLMPADGARDVANVAATADPRIAKLCNLFEAVVELAPAERAQALEGVSNHLARVKVCDTARDRLESRAMSIGAIAGFVSILVLSLWITVHYPWDGGLKAGFWGGFVGCAVVILGLAVWGSETDLSDAAWLVLCVSISAFAVVVGGGILYYGLRVSSEPPDAVLSYIAFGAGALGLAGLMTLVGTFLGIAFNSRWFRKYSTTYAEDLLVEALVDALCKVSQEEAWRANGTRFSVIKDIEHACRWVPYILPVDVAADPDTAAFVMDRRKCVIWNLRQLKRWVFTPQRGTRADLVSRLRSDLLAASNGAFDELCHEEVTAASEPRRIRNLLSQALRIIRSFIAALIPLGIALVLIRQEIVTGAAVTPLLAITAVLPAVVLLRVLDPGVLDDLKRAQELGPKLFQRETDAK